MITDIFRKGWRGELSLAKAYWLLLVLMSIMIWIVDIIFMFMANKYFTVFMVAINLCYSLCALNIVCNCSQKSKPLWRLYAQLTAFMYHLLMMLILLVTVLHLFWE